jgi:hypothetical protein
MGVVKKCGQFNAAFKNCFLVLSDAMLEYYEDEKTYLVEKQDGLKARTGGWAEDRGSIPTRNVKVISGAEKSNDGYLFTIEDTSNGKLIECACEDAQGRDMWVQKIQASYHHATVHGEKVTIAVYMRPEEGDDTGRTHYFHADNEQECLKWTKALHEAIANARKRQLLASMSAWRRTQIRPRRNKQIR